MTNLMNHAIAIAGEAFQGITDEGGVPHIFHNLYVMNAVRSENDLELSLIAILAGVTSVGNVSPANLRALGFPESVCDSVLLLAEDSSVMNYRVYSLNVATCPRASIVLKFSERYYSKVAQMASFDIFRLEAMTAQNKIAFLVGEA